MSLQTFVKNTLDMPQNLHIISSRTLIQGRDGDKDVYCVCMHSLLVDTHGNVKPNVYRVHIKIQRYPLNFHSHVRPYKTYKVFIKTPK